METRYLTSTISRVTLCLRYLIQDTKKLDSNREFHVLSKLQRLKIYQDARFETLVKLFKRSKYRIIFEMTRIFVAQNFELYFEIEIQETIARRREE